MSPTAILQTTRRAELLRWASWFAACNGLLLALFALNFVRYMPAFDHWQQTGYVAAALLGHFSLLAYLAFVVLLLPLLLLLPLRGLVRAVAVALGTLGTGALAVDYVVYAQYRFHLNGVLVDMVIRDGGEEIFRFSWVTWLTVAASLLVMLAGQVLLAWGLGRYLGRPRRGGSWFALLCVGSLLGSHAMHAWADAHYDRSITSLTRHIPFYYPTVAKRALERYGLIDLDANRELAREALANSVPATSELNYPRAALQCTPVGKPLNILYIIIDTWRFDQLGPLISPRMEAFRNAPGSQQFARHFSGGNSTLAGIFSLYYGLPSSYWDAMNGSMTGPVLVDQLRAQGYELGIFSSAKLTSPAFDRTVFAAVDDLRTESSPGAAWQRDREITEAWQTFVEHRDDSRPFYGLLYYDAVHSYSYPDDAEQPFRPVLERVDHLALDADFDPVPYLNRHRTAVRYVDGLVGQVIDQLQREGLYDNTLIVLTSDHGEEFNDTGLNYWGHGSNYTRYQVQVPMVIHWPGRPAQRFTHRTSHMDVTPTLMREVLGCRNEAADYSIGRSLFDRSPRPWIYAGSYFNYGVLLEDAVLVTYPIGNFEYVDAENRSLPWQSVGAATSLAVLRALSSFYR